MTMYLLGGVVLLGCFGLKLKMRGVSCWRGLGGFEVFDMLSVGKKEGRLW